MPDLNDFYAFKNSGGGNSGNNSGGGCAGGIFVLLLFIGIICFIGGLWK